MAALGRQSELIFVAEIALRLPDAHFPELRAGEERRASTNKTE